MATTIRQGSKTHAPAAEYAVLVGALIAVMASAVLLLGIFGP